MASVSSVRIAVVVPSVGRESLVATVRSASWADVVFVVFDGPEVRWGGGLPAGTRVAFWPELEAANDWGMVQRNYALRLFAQGKWGVSHVSFMDDDDVYAPGAGDVIRAAVTADPDSAHFFCMQRRGGEVIGRHRRVEGGMVGTPMMVVPVGKHGTWGEGEYEGDRLFAESTEKVVPVRWHDDVIALIGGFDE